MMRSKNYTDTAGVALRLFRSYVGALIFNGQTFFGLMTAVDDNPDVPEKQPTRTWFYDPAQPQNPCDLTSNVIYGKDKTYIDPDGNTILTDPKPVMCTHCS